VSETTLSPPRAPRWRRWRSHPALPALLTALVLLWLVYRFVRPRVYGVSAVPYGAGTLVIRGEHLGHDGHITVSLEDRANATYRVTRWRANEVALTVDGGVDRGGTVRLVKHLLFFDWPLPPVPFVVQAPGLPSAPYGYEVPVQPASPWPLFRRDRRNSGSSPLVAAYNGDDPWSFTTGKGIFSTPVVDAGGTIYVGSADHTFYALHPDGREKWRFTSGEIIDSAAALPRAAPGSVGAVVVPSGDGFLYRLDRETGAPQWTFDATVAPRAAYNNWWEGNVGVGYDGTYYAGNTNFNYYAIAPDGRLRWTYATGANNWSLAAIGDDGTLYWASNDTFIRAVWPDGTEKWRKRTLGFIAASAALGSDGTVYIGSFDSYFYALDGDTGATLWRFKTNDHIYSSAALAEDEQGRTTAIFFGSADGSLYALNPEGQLLWQYDTGDPIRSSPVLGQAPAGAGQIVYVGSGNGHLYALNAAAGTRRWSFDTTVDTLELRDRNDLNGSPALGASGVYIGGEHGLLWYVPYDYCLQRTDPRCHTTPGEDLPDDVTGFYYVTPGGSTVWSGVPTVPASSLITLRLLVREAGKTVDAWVCNLPVGCPRDALTVTASPPFPFRVQQSADGHFLHLIPDGFLRPGTTYTITVTGNVYSGGTNVGNLTLGGSRRGQVNATVTLHTAPPVAASLPLTKTAGAVTALEWTRLATPLPAMLPSLNQIGFDYMDWILGTVALAPETEATGRFVWWAIGARRDETGTLVADPDSDFTLPLSGSYEGDTFTVANSSFTMAITGIPIPFNLLQMRGQLDAGGRVGPGATVYAETEALSIPTFGPYLVLAGLANNGWEKLTVAGTYVTRPYPPSGPASQRPPGVALDTLSFKPPMPNDDGAVRATLSLAPGAAYPAAGHRPGILLLDVTRTEAVPLDYHANLTHTVDARGNLASITLTLPAGTSLPDTLDAVVILDVFPLDRRRLAP
jgi:outer membrane protein assembly factor BamB